MKKLLAITVLTATLAAVSACGSSSRSSATAISAPTVDTTLSGSELVEGYKQWTRVNPVPAILHAPTAILCGIPTNEQLESRAKNPHLDKFITVYVNEVGKQAMMQMKSPVFPLGSVIVKEKLVSKDSTSPELLTAMRKREPGYNPGNGDWEYMVLNGPGKTVQARGKLDKCQGCHLMNQGSDYVSRNYLPEDVRRRLK